MNKTSQILRSFYIICKFNFGKILIDDIDINSLSDYYLFDR